MFKFEALFYLLGVGVYPTSRSIRTYTKSIKRLNATVTEPHVKSLRKLGSLNDLAPLWAVL